MVATIKLSKENIILPDYRGRLLEGVTYDDRTNSILWVDIILAEIHRLQLDTYKHEVIKSKTPGDSIGTIALTSDDDRVILGDKIGVSEARFSTGDISRLLKYPANDKVRSNDGKMDPYGNLIVGTMFNFTEESAPIGELYQVNNKLELKKMRSECLIPNGLGFTQDKSFYWTDSPRGKMYKFDYDPSTGTLSNESVFFNINDHFPESVGAAPDGMCISSKDFFFISVFNGHCVLKVNKSGEVVGKYELPAQRITCCTIGGPKGDELWITTAHADHEDLDKEIVADGKGDLGGYLFRVTLDEAQPEPQYRWA